MGIKFRVYIGSTYFEFDSYEACSAYRTAHGSPTDDIMSVTYTRPSLSYIEPIQLLMGMNVRWKKVYNLTNAQIISIGTTLKDLYTYLLGGNMARAESFITGVATTADFTQQMRDEMITAVLDIKLLYGQN